MRILVTGASGFVGQALVPALAKAGDQVRAAARNPAIIPAIAGVTPVILPDFSASFDARDLIGNAEAIVHLAGLAHASAAIPGALYDQVNHQATMTIAQAAAAKQIKRFIFVSSIRAQAGPYSDEILTEETTPQPSDAYGRSKRAAEDAVRAAGVPYTILRPVVIYGPHAKGNVAKLARLAESPWPLPFASFDNHRSMLALDNLVSAVRFALDNPKTQNETYIVADRTAVSIADIISILRISQNRAPNLFSIPPALLQTMLKLIGRDDLWQRIGGRSVADAAKLRSAGWVPPYDTREGLAAMVQAASP